MANMIEKKLAAGRLLISQGRLCLVHHNLTPLAAYWMVALKTVRDLKRCMHAYDEVSVDENELFYMVWEECEDTFLAAIWNDKKGFG